jgi:hypothetical protein
VLRPELALGIRVVGNEQPAPGCQLECGCHATAALYDEARPDERLEVGAESPLELLAIDVLREKEQPDERRERLDRSQDTQEDRHVRLPDAEPGVHPDRADPALGVVGPVEEGAD